MVTKTNRQLSVWLFGILNPLQTGYLWNNCVWLNILIGQHSEGKHYVTHITVKFADVNEQKWMEHSFPASIQNFIDCLFFFITCMTRVLLTFENGYVYNIIFLWHQNIWKLKQLGCWGIEDSTVSFIYNSDLDGVRLQHSIQNHIRRIVGYGPLTRVLHIG